MYEILTDLSETGKSHFTPSFQKTFWQIMLSINFLYLLLLPSGSQGLMHPTLAVVRQRPGDMDGQIRAPQKDKFFI